MEEGGEIGPYYNASSKDHLATILDLVEVREPMKNKQWLVSGFNGFGQFKFENKRKLLQFEDFQLPLNNNNAEVLIACSWNCLAIANEQTLYLQGFISESPNTVKTIKTSDTIKAIALCDKYCLILQKNGKVYKLLQNKEDDLREIVFQTSPTTTTFPQKRYIFGEIKKKSENLLEIAHIACGNNITIAISTTNAVFSATTQIYQFPKHQRIKQLKCGFEHALVLTTNGDIYGWGNGLRGQLGFEVLRVEEIPSLIEALAGVKITFIACGGWHSAAISAFGDLYMWGFNSNGQLGLRVYKEASSLLKEPTVYPLPQLIDLPVCECCEKLKDNRLELNCSPIKVEAGGRHTIIQMNCGSIYACGWNAYGQLGLADDKEYCDNFKFVIKLEDEIKMFNKQIICGNWCTIIEK
ncbi:uncharacterized protein ACRADG_001458 [Cochliomyia hominivorax]